MPKLDAIQALMMYRSPQGERPEINIEDILERIKSSDNPLQDPDLSYWSLLAPYLITHHLSRFEFYMLAQKSGRVGEILTSMHRVPVLPVLTEHLVHHESKIPISTGIVMGTQKSASEVRLTFFPNWESFLKNRQANKKDNKKDSKAALWAVRLSDLPDKHFFALLTESDGVISFKGKISQSDYKNHLSQYACSKESSEQYTARPGSGLVVYKKGGQRAPEQFGASLLWYLSSTRAGFNVLKDLIKEDADLSEVLSSPAVDWIQPEGPSQGTSVLWFLFCTVWGVELVDHVLEKDPGLWKTLLEKAICVYPPKRNRLLQAPLILWCGSERKGQLLSVMEQDPAILDRIPLKAWFWSPSLGESEGKSAVWWLCASKGGVDFIGALFNLNYKLAVCLVTVAVGLKPLGETNGDAPPLYHLCRSNRGLSLLSLVNNQVPGLCHHVSPEAWRWFPDKSYHEMDQYLHGRSTLWYLCWMEGGLRFLGKLFAVNKGFAVSVLSEALAWRPVSKDLIIEPPLWNMCAYPVGRELLRKLLEYDVSVSKNIPSETLRWHASLGSNQNTSVLWWLSFDSAGCCMLGKMLDENPAVFKGIPATEILISPCRKGYQGKSVLWLMSGCPEGQANLARLVEINPEWKGAFSRDDIEQMPPQAHSSFDDKTLPEPQESVATRLGKSDAGITMLSQLLQKEPSDSTEQLASSCGVFTGRKGRLGQTAPQSPTAKLLASGFKFG